MKQVLYKNDIYPYNVRVLLGADEEYIVKTFANLEHKFKKEEEK